jgi:hypothetical protein
LRNLFLLLVLINLGVLAWVAWIVPEPEPATRYEGPGITLLRELEEDAPILVASRPRDPPSAAPDGDPAQFARLNEAPPQAAHCVALGPFTDAAEADSALVALTQAGFAPTLSVTEEEIWDGYWVFIGGLPSVAVAEETLAQLAANGIGDAYVIPNSDSGILISLGVFSDIARAGTQAERAGRLGPAATITERTRTAETRWLELELSGEESQALDLLQEPGRIRRLEQRECRNGDGV